MEELGNENVAPDRIGEKRNPDGTYAPGHVGGPGRPKGTLSIKDLVRQHLQDNPAELKAFVQHFIDKNRELAWQMLEGRPQQDVVSDGKALPSPLLNVLDHHGDTKDSEVKETH